jgi:importin-4
MCNLIVTSTNPQVRQYSAVLLRKQLAKLRNWQVLPKDQQEAIKQGVAQALVIEPENSVRKAIAMFIGVLVKHEFAKKDQWSMDLLKFIFDNSSSADPKQSELGSSTFAILTDIAPDQFVPHMEAICQMFTAALVATEASGNMTTPAIFNILLGMSHLVPFVLGNTAVEHTYQASVPYVVKALAGFAVQDSYKFIEAFDILENLADDASKLLTPHLKMLMEFCLSVGNNKDIDEGARIKAIAFIGWLVRLKKKMIIKQKLVEPIIRSLFELMSQAPEVEDEDEEYFGSNEVNTPMTTATQTMDVLALHIPPKQLIPTLLELIEPALKTGTNPLSIKASYLCMAVIAEGCSEAICSKYLRPFLDCIKIGITSDNTMIRNAALFALGQFSEHLQPEISQHGEEILPILFEFLHQLCAQLQAGGTEPPHIDRVFYALETFCENLEDALLPHLPVLMDRLFEALSPANSVHLRELALSAVSATANAAKTNMVPYFPRLIEGLKAYMIVTDDEDICTLRSGALDTLAALTRTIGEDNFRPLAADTMNLGLHLLENSQEDPDLRRSCFNLFASLASVLKSDVAPVLPKIVEAMITSVKSTEGVMSAFSPESDDEENGVNGSDMPEDNDIDIENSEGEDEDGDELAGFSVENAYMDEKEEAILALMELAEHSGPAFAPFIQTAFEEIYKLINYPNEDIRKSSIDALKQFVITLHQLNNTEDAKKALLILIPKLSEIIKTDEERTVVMSALDAFNDILDKMGAASQLVEGQRDAIFSCIMDVFNAKIACQFDEPVEEDQDESEYGRGPRPIAFFKNSLLGLQCKFQRGRGPRPIAFFKNSLLDLQCKFQRGRGPRPIAFFKNSLLGLQCKFQRGRGPRPIAFFKNS